MTRAVLSTIVSLSIAGIASAQVTDEVSPYLTRTEPQEWILKSSVTLTPNLTGLRQEGSLTVDDEYEIEQGTIFYPLPEISASHERDLKTVEAKLIFRNGREIPIRQNLVSEIGPGVPLHSNETYGTWMFEDVTIGANMIFEVESRITTWNTSFDEKAAMLIPWPEGDWPAEASSTFDPELFIDEGYEGSLTTNYVEKLADKLVRGKARSQPPMVSAKWIAGEVAKRYQPHGHSIVSDSRPATAQQTGMSLGAINSFNIYGAEEAARSMKGSSFDMALLLTAVYREVGLPARLVVGYVAGGTGGGKENFRSSDKPEIGTYAWVEVALYDESQPRPDQQLTWVPVDIDYIRSARVYGRKFDQPWDGFGTSDRLNEIIPVGFHLHPHRMGAISYGGDINIRRGALWLSEPRNRAPRPSLWGWNTVPELPAIFEQTIGFTATSPSRRPGDPKPGERRGQ